MSGFRTLLDRIEDTFSGRRVRSADVLRRDRTASSAARKPGYHAVGIKPGGNGLCCDVVLALEGQRFLSAEAPPLPLPDCDALECTCTYRHYDDRRHGSRRAGDRGMSKKAYDGPERRAAEDRRQNGEELEFDLEEEATFFTDAADYFYR